MKIQVYSSLYRHVHRLAQAVAEGVREGAWKRCSAVFPRLSRRK